MLRVVTGDVVEEFVIINWFISLHESNFFGLLNRSEVLPLIKWESSIWSKTAESLVKNGLLQRGELVTSLGYTGAVIFNWVNDLAKSVKLSYTLWGNNNALIFVNNDLCSGGSIKDNTIVFTCEVNVHFCQFLSELFQRWRKGGEDEVWWWAPVENLGGESVLQLGVVKRIGHIIVLDSTFKVLYFILLPLILPQNQTLSTLRSYCS